LACCTLGVSNPWGYPQLFQVKDDHDLVLKQLWLKKPPYLPMNCGSPMT
jgi:hypothetical protein